MTPAIWVVIAISWLATVPSRATAQTWTEFRGPQGTGIVSGVQFPVEHLENSIAWKTPVHGKGWSSPVVSENRIWLTTATEDGREMSVICLDAGTGRMLLDRVLHRNENPDFCHPTNSYASPTPVVELGRVYLHFGKYGTTCLDTESFETIWQRVDFECDHFRGPASSPILYDDQLIVAFDGADHQYVVAMSKTTGETVWKTEREIKYGTENGDFKKAYGTGTIFEIDGTPLLVYPSAVATIAYQPKTGKPVWTAYHGGMNVSARVQQTSNGLLLIGNGMGKLFAIDPRGTGDITETHIRWRLAKGVARKSSPLIVNDRMFMVNDQGVASWYRTDTGEAIWQQRVGGAFSASPIFDGHAIFAFSESGQVLAFAADDTYELLGETELADGFKATPAVDGDRMILRSLTEVISIQGRPTGPQP